MLNKKWRTQNFRYFASLVKIGVRNQEKRIWFTKFKTKKSTQNLTYSGARLTKYDTYSYPEKFLTNNLTRYLPNILINNKKKISSRMIIVSTYLKRDLNYLIIKFLNTFLLSLDMVVIYLTSNYF